MSNAPQVPGNRIPLLQTGHAQMDQQLRQLFEIVQALGQNPFFNGTLLTQDTTVTPAAVGFTFTAGQTRTLPHPLGRVFSGIIPIGLQQAATGGYISWQVLVNPTGQGADKWFTMQMQNQTTCGFWIY